MTSETSPAPSETAEEIAREFCQRNRIGDQQVLLAAMLREAKRSAHLEDARAGCQYCAGRWTQFRAQPITGTLVWGKLWVHLHDCRDDDGVVCERPEVLDALSLLGKP